MGFWRPDVIYRERWQTTLCIVSVEQVRSGAAVVLAQVQMFGEGQYWIGWGDDSPEEGPFPPTNTIGHRDHRKVIPSGFYQVSIRTDPPAPGTTI